MVWSQKLRTKHNTSFRFSDVRYLATQWISSLAAGDSSAYIDHILKVEEIFKESDRFIEHFEEAIIDEDDGDVSLEEEEGVLD